ncbi:Ankyrin repeat-containing domain, partial [Trinorchestia longiramus]
VQWSQQHHDLRHAALHGRIDVITRLLKAGVSVDQTLRQGWTALMYACSSAQPEAVKVLLVSGADPNFHKGDHIHDCFSQD